MGFLDHAKRRVAGLRGDDLTSDGRPTPRAERLEPTLEEGKPPSTAPVDPEISRMAQAFEALYSPAPSPTDRYSLGWTDNDNFFANMPHESNVAAAPGDAALLRRDTPDSQTRTPTSRRDLPSPAEPFTASQKKTTIEMVFDMRRAAEDKARTALMQSRSAPPPPASREARSLEPEVSARERPASGEGRVQLPLDTRSVVSGASASHDGEASPFEGSAWSPRAQEPRDRSTEWSSRQRRVHARMLAGAALALVIGTGVGYMAGKGESATSRAAVESTDSGMKLRLDRDLR